MADLALRCESLVAAKAKERQGKRTDLNIRENSHECSDGGRTDETLAPNCGYLIQHNSEGVEKAQEGQE